MRGVYDVAMANFFLRSRGAAKKIFQQERIICTTGLANHSQSPTVVELKGIWKFRLDLVP